MFEGNRNEFENSMSEFENDRNEFEETRNEFEEEIRETIETETVQEESLLQQPVVPMETPAQKKRHRKRRNVYVRALCSAIIFGVVAGGIIMGSAAVSKNVIMKRSPVEPTAAKLSTAAADNKDSDSSANGAEYTVSQIAAQCKSSVVAITNKSISEIRTMFGIMEQESEGSGSGVIIGQNDTELLIATNNHVVDNSETLTVCFNDSEDAVFNAQVKGTDAENDLAVVAIKLSDISEEVLDSISIATIGDSESLVVGDGVVAIGNALGIGQSVTSGIVSATNREVTVGDVTTTLLQTDAAINPGNSGGALFNMKGELIGINSAKFASEQIEGMGFAIPMATAQPIIEDLMNRVTREKVENGSGYLNIAGMDVSEEASQMYGIPQGAYISEAYEDGAAAKAGIQKGDIITKLDGKAIGGIDELREELQYYKAGESVEVVIQRNSGGGYEEQTLTVKLDSSLVDQPSDQNRQQIPYSFDNRGGFE